MAANGCTIVVALLGLSLAAHGANSLIGAWLKSNINEAEAFPRMPQTRPRRGRSVPSLSVHSFEFLGKSYSYENVMLGSDTEQVPRMCVHVVNSSWR